MKRSSAWRWIYRDMGRRGGVSDELFIVLYFFFFNAGPWCLHGDHRGCERRRSGLMGPRRSAVNNVWFVRRDKKRNKAELWNAGVKVACEGRNYKYDGEMRFED